MNVQGVLPWICKLRKTIEETLKKLEPQANKTVWKNYDLIIADHVPCAAF